MSNGAPGMQKFMLKPAQKFLSYTLHWTANHFGPKVEVHPKVVFNLLLQPSKDPIFSQGLSQADKSSLAMYGSCLLLSIRVLMARVVPADETMGSVNFRGISLQTLYVEAPIGASYDLKKLLSLILLIAHELIRAFSGCFYCISSLVLRKSHYGGVIHNQEDFTLCLFAGGCNGRSA
ncbi:hypothetical protein Scep_010564 [Stephania cephalantha]|uniref:Uncharacterized protein n=1 Tax=Stephania cephalantha TaxID=152367 RepID=A0AAP0JWL2_9MAGN